MPITPNEAQILKQEIHLQSIPDEVFASFDWLIATNLSNQGTSRFTQDAIIAKIQEKLPDVTRQEIFDNKWLDIEPYYEKVGWTVEYSGNSWYGDTDIRAFTFKA